MDKKHTVNLNSEKKSQGDSLEDQEHAGAREKIEKFNQEIDQKSHEFPERDINFDGKRILFDSKSVHYTYEPKDGVPQEHHPHAHIQDESDDFSDSDVSVEEKNKVRIGSLLATGINSIYKDVSANSRVNTEMQHWELLNNWRQENVRYKCIRDIPGYSFKGEDELGYYASKVLECQDFFRKKIDDSSQTEKQVNFNMLSHYEVNQITGEKFLRLTMREWKTSYDPEIDERRIQWKPRGQKVEVQQEQKKEYEVHSFKFLKFDEQLQKFEIEDEILYDISKEFLDINASGFSNDVFLTKNEHTYYYVKDEDRHGFQLYRHSYGTPFQKFPIDNDPFPCHQNEVMEGYFIKAPKRKVLEDLQICFMRDASKNYSLRNDQLSEELDFLINEFVIVRDKIYQKKQQEADDPDKNVNKCDIYIYNVASGKILYNSTKDKDTKEKDIHYEFFQIGFFLQPYEDDEVQHIFIIKCQRMDYEIKITKQGPEVDQERSEFYQRYNQHMVMPQNLDIHLERLQENFNQAFFFTKLNCNVNFIYPLHSTKEENISSDIKNKQEEVSKHIAKNFLNSESGKIVYQDKEFAYLFNDNFTEKILSDINPKTGFNISDEYISTNNMILKVNVSENIIHVWSQKPEIEFSSFRETLTELVNDRENMLQQIILEQFNLDNQKIYGDNYKTKQNLGIYQNQYLNRVYLTQRECVYLQHHKAFIYGSEPTEVPDNVVLMDLGDQDGQISMLRLYDDRLFSENQCDLKLNAYHTSYSAGLVAFFFIQRNCLKQSDMYSSLTNQTGVEFMLIHKIDDLKTWSNNFKQGIQKGCVLQKYSPIFIFGPNVKKLIYTAYDHSVVLKYQDNAKAASLMASTLVHEMVYDPKNPVDYIAPFLFSNEKQRKPTPVFQWFFCFLNLKLVQKHVESSILAKNRTEVLSFDNFCDLFLLRNVEDPITSLKLDDDQIIYENNRTRDCPLLCRSAAWTSFTEQVLKNVKGIDFEDFVQGQEGEKIHQYSTRFQIGFVINPKDTQLFEIHGYVVNMCNKKVYRNTDLLDVFDKSLDSILSNTKIEPYRQQHVIPSASANESFIGKQMLWENHRLIPKINNHGRVTGTFLMLNLYMIYKENMMITFNTDMIKSQRKNISEEVFDVIMKNSGQEVLLLRPLNAAQCLIYLQSGRQYEVPTAILVDENQERLSLSQKPKPVFVYQMIKTTDNSNPDYDPFFKFRTPLMHVGVKQFALDGQPNKLMTLVTTRFNREIVAKQIFNRIAMQTLLNQQQIYAITASIPSFKEVFKSKQQQKSKCYFQFRFIFFGRSFCSLDFPSFKSSIQNLVQAIEGHEINYAKICEDSAIYNMLDYSSPVDDQKNFDILKQIYSMLQIEPQNFFQANWNYESFIQKSLDNNMNRPLIYLMEHLLQTKDEAVFKTVLIQDLPQLLTQDQVDIFHFFEEYKPSQQDLDSVDGSTKRDGCRLETILQNPDLPILGSSDLVSTLVENVKCAFNMRQEIEDHIMDEFTTYEKERQEQLQELISQNKDIPSDISVNVEHTFINFIPMINKIKIDLLMNRNSSSLNYTQYLARIHQKPEEFDHIDDLFLAELISNNQENLDFFKLESVQKLIDRQFNYTKMFIQRLLLIFFFGFVLPQIINIYINGLFFEKDMPDDIIILQMILYVTCGSTQIFFATLEYAEINYSGWKSYLNDGYNYMDGTQGIFYTIQVFLKCHQNGIRQHTASKFWLEMVTIICLIQSSIKFLQLIRYNESFCSLVEMLTQVFVDIYPFLIVFFTFNIVFVLTTYILEGGYDDESYPYLNIFPLIINNLQTFRNSIGDLSEPDYGKWFQNVPEKTDYLQNQYQYAVMITVWIFFVINIFVMQIVLLNFLIAEVSMTYSRIKDLGPCLIYQKKQELNFFVQKIIKVYGKENPFKALIFTAPKCLGEDEDDFSEINKAIKESISYEMRLVSEEMVPNQKKMQEMSTTNMNCIEDLDKNIHKLQDKLQEVTNLYRKLSGQPLEQSNLQDDTIVRVQMSAQSERRQASRR